MPDLICCIVFPGYDSIVIATRLPRCYFTERFARMPHPTNVPTLLVTFTRCLPVTRAVVPDWWRPLRYLVVVPPVTLVANPPPHH